MHIIIKKENIKVIQQDLVMKWKIDKITLQTKSQYGNKDSPIENLG